MTLLTHDFLIGPGGRSRKSVTQCELMQTIKRLPVGGLHRRLAWLLIVAGIGAGTSTGAGWALGIATLLVCALGTAGLARPGSRAVAPLACLAALLGLPVWPALGWPVAGLALLAAGWGVQGAGPALTSR